MERRVRIGLWVGWLAILVLGGLAVIAAPRLREVRGSALYSTPIQVVGQVVDERTGLPLAGATVYVLRGGTRPEAERDLEELLKFAAEYPEESGNYGTFGARVLTDAEGRFDVTLMLSYCCAHGPGVERRYPPARHGARIVLIEKDGYRRTFFLTETGTWTVLVQDRLFDPYGLVDTRVLQLPPTE